jgi:hypothetical protein
VEQAVWFIQGTFSLLCFLSRAPAHIICRLTRECGAAKLSAETSIAFLGWILHDMMRGCEKFSCLSFRFPTAEFTTIALKLSAASRFYR